MLTFFVPFCLTFFLTNTVIAAYYGFRRSEVLGLKWSAIDFDNNTITVSHTVARVNLDGKPELIAKNRTKTKASFRTLPLIPHVKEVLLEAKARQKKNQKLCRKQYNREYLEYVCVDNMGNLIYPDRVSRGFPRSSRNWTCPTSASMISGTAAPACSWQTGSASRRFSCGSGTRTLRPPPTSTPTWT